MEYVYGALLLHSAGKKVDEEGLCNVLKAAGIEVDMARVKALVSALEGVNVDEAIKSAAMPTAVAPAAPAVQAAQAAAPEKPEKKEEKKVEEEKKEEEALAGLGALFG